MKFIARLLLFVAILLSPSCDTIHDLSDDSIPETSVFEPISAARLTAISVSEPLFSTMYATIHLAGIHKPSSRLRNSYPSVTYRSIFNLYKLGTSTAKECKDLRQRFRYEWDCHPEFHPLYDSASEFVGSRCAEFASEVFRPEVDLLKDAFSEVWDALRESWNEVF